MRMFDLNNIYIVQKTVTIQSLLAFIECVLLRTLTGIAAEYYDHSWGLVELSTLLSWVLLFRCIFVKIQLGANYPWLSVE